MERVRLTSSASQAKIIGTVVSMSGALVVVLYKGPKLLAPSHYHNLTLSQSSWILGGILLAAQYLLISVWLIIQVQKHSS